MESMIRVATASVLAISIATAPLVLDHCAASCEADHDAVASTASCHHASTATGTIRIGQIPSPCGHDHSGTIVTVTKAAPSALSLSWIALDVTISAPLLTGNARRNARISAPPGSSLTLDRRSLPFRI
jgi:hypothetical protein